MIDLTYSKRQMLSDIGIPFERVADLCQGQNGRSFHAAPEAYLHVTGQTRDEMLPSVEQAFRQRFRAIPPDHLFSDLLVLVKSGLGNAHKRGNLEDPNKTITLEAVATHEGAVVTISDEGNGFDVDSVFERFRRNERYFTNQGKGLQRFVQSRSLVSYSNNGRSLHIRFLCQPVPGQPLEPQDFADFGEAANSDYMQLFFAEAYRQPVRQCRVYRPHYAFSNQRRLLYALRLGNQAKLLTGDLLTIEGLQTAVSLTKQLDVEKIAAETGVHILRPVTYLTTPPIAFYPFNPQRSLDKVFKKHEDLASETLPLVRQIGAALRRLHTSQITLSHFEDVATRMETITAVSNTILKTLSSDSPQRLPVVTQLLAQLQAQAGRLQDARPVPIHGDLSWYTILQGEKRLYLHGLENGRYSHPAFDLGAFLADLMRHFESPEANAYLRSQRAFLSAYFGAGERPLWANDLPFFIAVALILRLERLLKRPYKKWNRKIDRLLANATFLANAA